MLDSPLVDVIIPLHDVRRPLHRPLASLLRSGLDVGSGLRINVVAHNITEDDVRGMLDPELFASVRVLECHDGLPSPAGPRTIALEHADARYVSFLDSDDHLDDGALSDWLERAERHDLDVVIAPERHDTGAKIRTPPTRPWRRRDLDPVRDRLSYRTAPLGLIRRSAITRVGARYETEVRNGSDQVFTLMLWFGQTRVRFARGGPGYVVGSDSSDRVTKQLQPMESELRATLKLLRDPWFLSLGDDERHSIVVKFVRIHFIGAVTSRLSTAMWTTEAEESATEFLLAARTASETFANSLSIADVRLCNAILDRASVSELARFARERRSFGTPRTVLTRSARNVLDVDSPLRFMAASFLH